MGFTGTEPAGSDIGAGRMTATQTTWATGERVTGEPLHHLEQFLYDEAAALDEWRFRDWLGYFSDDVHYWAPVRHNRVGRELSRETARLGENAHFDERGLAMLEQRVRKLETGLAWAEEPPSRTRHLITNVRAWSNPEDAGYRVESAFLVYRSRLERDIEIFVGRRRDSIVGAGEPSRWRICAREVLLDQTTITAKNLSCFF